MDVLSHPLCSLTHALLNLTCLNAWSKALLNDHLSEYPLQYLYHLYAVEIFEGLLFLWLRLSIQYLFIDYNPILLSWLDESPNYWFNLRKRWWSNGGNQWHSLFSARSGVVNDATLIDQWASRNEEVLMIKQRLSSCTEWLAVRCSKVWFGSWGWLLFLWILWVEFTCQKLCGRLLTDINLILIVLFFIRNLFSFS